MLSGEPKEDRLYLPRGIDPDRKNLFHKETKERVFTKYDYLK